MSKQIKCKIMKPTKPQASAMYHMKRKAGLIFESLKLMDSGNIIARCTNGKNATFTPDGTVRLR